MGFVRRLFGVAEVFRFLAWLKDEYSEARNLKYRPDQFRQFGNGVRVGRRVRINRPDRVVLKDRVSIAEGVVINSIGGLWIGENSGVGANSTIFTAQHHYRRARSIPFDTIGELKPVVIREFVWIGAGVMILPGVEIGEGAIVGMGSVIARDVPPQAIVFGNPAEVIMYRDKAHYSECKNSHLVQEISVGQYEEVLVPVYKRKYSSELADLGMI